MTSRWCIVAGAVSTNKAIVYYVGVSKTYIKGLLCAVLEDMKLNSHKNNPILCLFLGLISLKIPLEITLWFSRKTRFFTKRFVVMSFQKYKQIYREHLVKTLYEI